MKKLLLTLLLTVSFTAHAAIFPLPDEPLQLSAPTVSFLSKIKQCKLNIRCYFRQTLGATITSMAGTDTLKASRTVINDNFTSLNNYKIENSSSSIAAITTLANLVSIGTITTGGWNGTAIPVAYGGSGTTTWAANLVLVGSTTNGVGTVVGHGASGQVLGSNGAGLAPTWQTLTVGLANNNAWTGRNQFSGATTSISSPDNGITLGGVGYILPSTLSGIASGTVATLVPDSTASGTIRWQQAPIGFEYLNQTVTTGAQATVTVSGLPNRRQFIIKAYAPSVSTGGKTFMSFQCCDQNYQWMVVSATSTTGRDHKTNNFFNGFQLQELFTNATEEHYYTVNVYNLASGDRQFDWTGSAKSTNDTYPRSAQGSGLWATTTASLIDVIFFANGDGQVATFGAGAVLSIFGSRD